MAVMMYRDVVTFKTFPLLAPCPCHSSARITVQIVEQIEVTNAVHVSDSLSLSLLFPSSHSATKASNEFFIDSQPCH